MLTVQNNIRRVGLQKNTGSYALVALVRSVRKCVHDWGCGFEGSLPACIRAAWPCSRRGAASESCERPVTDTECGYEKFALALQPRVTSEVEKVLIHTAVGVPLTVAVPIHEPSHLSF